MKIYSPAYQTIAEIPQALKTEVEKGRFYHCNRKSVYKVDSDYYVASFNLLERIWAVVMQLFGKDYLGDRIRAYLNKTNVVRVSLAELSSTAQKTAAAATPAVAPPALTPAPAPTPAPEPEKRPIAPTLSEQEQKDWEKVGGALLMKSPGQVLKLYLPEHAIATREDLLDFHVLSGTIYSWAKIPDYLLIQTSERDAIQSNLNPHYWRNSTLISRELAGKQLMQSMASQNLCKSPKEQEFVRELLLVKWPQQNQSNAAILGCKGNPNAVELVLNECLRQKAIHSWGFGRGAGVEVVVKFKESDQVPAHNIPIHFKTLEQLLAVEKFQRETKIVLDEKLLGQLPAEQQKDIRFLVNGLLNQRTEYGVKVVHGDVYEKACEWLLQNHYIVAFTQNATKPKSFQIFVKKEDQAVIA